MVELPDIADRKTVFCTILSAVTQRKTDICVALLDEPGGTRMIEDFFGDGYVRRANELTEYVMKNRSPLNEGASRTGSPVSERGMSPREREHGRMFGDNPPV